MSTIHFLECNNPDCAFRFPLDLSQYKGFICPRCGAALIDSSSQSDQWEPRWTPRSNFDFVGVLDNVRSAHNVGSIFRTAEGVGMSRLYLCGLSPSPKDNSAVTKAALGAENRLKWSEEANAPRLVARLKSDGYQIIVLEALPQAENVFSMNDSLFKKNNKIALIAGNEPAGVDPAVIALADQILFIPMAGVKSSLNVSVAFGITAYTLLSKIEAFQ